MTIRHKNKGLIIKKRTGKRNFMSGAFKVPEKIVSIVCIFGLLITMNLPFLSAYEAHVINVTAKVCKDMGRTATIGYWKNHPEDYMPHLPMYLGSELITNESEANFIFNYGDDATSMMNKLKGQLLAMKFGVVHFGVGDYFFGREEDILAGILQDLKDAGKDTQEILDYFGTDDGKTFKEIVADAEDMFTADPVPNDEELEAMKNLINGINNLHEIRYCALPPPEIILNEFLPNPYGDDEAGMPDGEWVELFNNSDIDIDVDGWYLYDSYDEHPLEITPENSDNNGDPADIGETVVPSYGWLVVYVNGKYSGWLNNAGGDNIRLYDGEIDVGMLVSSYAYTSDAPSGKSFARIPDGIGEWVDPVPTPGATNILEDYPIASSSPALNVADVTGIDDGDGTADSVGGEDTDGTDVDAVAVAGDGADTGDDTITASDISDDTNGSVQENGTNSNAGDDNIDSGNADDTGDSDDTNDSSQETGANSGDDTNDDTDTAADDDANLGDDITAGADDTITDDSVSDTDIDDVIDNANNDDDMDNTTDSISNDTSGSTQEYEASSKDADGFAQENGTDSDIGDGDTDTGDEGETGGEVKPEAGDSVSDNGADDADDANDPTQEHEASSDDANNNENTGDLSADPDGSVIEFNL